MSYEPGDRVYWSDVVTPGTLIGRVRDEDTGELELCGEEHEGAENGAQLWTIRFDDGGAGWEKKHCCETGMRPAPSRGATELRMRMPDGRPWPQYSPDALIESGEPKPGPSYFAMDPASEKGDRTNFVWFGDGAAEVAELTEKLRCSENVRYNLAGRIKELEAGIPTVDVARLVAQRDEHRDKADAISALLEVTRNERDGLGAALSATQDRLADALATIAAKDARIAELDSQLAVLRRAACDGPISDAAPYPVNPNAPKPSPPDTTSPTTKGQVPGPPGHNPFRDFPADRRRIGG